MMPSLRKRLITILLPTIALLWTLSALYSYKDTQQEISKLLDTQLSQSGRVLMALSTHELVEQRLLSETNNSITELVAKNLWQHNEAYESQIAFQIWLHDKILTLKSNNAPDKPMSIKHTGFSNVTFFGNPWRVFSLTTEDNIITVQIAMHSDIQDTIGSTIIEKVVIPLVLLLPLLTLFIWAGSNSSLAPFAHIASQLTDRKTSDLSPIDEPRMPSEFRPITAAINQLFLRMKTAFDTEKRFTSDAAHELRTPLAALKTHAEIALQSKTETEQQKALRHVVQGVNRATRLVEQLLTLARLDPDTGFTNIRRFDLFIAAETVLSNEAHLALDKDIEISLSGTRGKFVAGNSDAICVLMRNLIDNAIRYTPHGGEVEVHIERKEPGNILLSVMDSGPGIPIEERSKIFNRFYRSLGTKESGSGLGLSIVTRISDLHHLSISLDTSRMGGLQIDILFSAKDYDGISEEKDSRK